ncbi:hypothetical protein Plhal304r1_c012g0045231 [Plasmopara halstedii]
MMGRSAQKYIEAEVVGRLSMSRIFPKHENMNNFADRASLPISSTHFMTCCAQNGHKK